MPAFFAEIDVSGQAAYPGFGSPQVLVPFAPDEYLFVNRSSDTSIFFSYDGVNDHGELRPNSPTTGEVMKSVERRVWLRRGALGPSGSALVQVSAATDR